MRLSRLFVYLMLFAAATALQAQNLVGYRVSEIKRYMKENHKDMKYQTFTNNSTFRYLKYADTDESRTMLFMLEPDSICKSVRIIYDKSLKAEKVKELDNLYKKKSEFTWTETKNGKVYLIEMREEDYSFNITIKQN